MKQNKNIKDLNWTLAGKFLNNESDLKEKSKLKEWLNQSVDFRFEMDQFKKMLDSVDAYYGTKKFNSEDAWEKVQKRIQPEQNKMVEFKKIRKEALTQFLKYAAIFVFAILLGSIGYYIGFRNQVPAFYNEIISAENQVLFNYVLPDGTAVALNSNSQLMFPKNFKKDIREVTISGEAFFDVKPIPEKPFIINAGNAQVKVIGTSFSVSAYPEAETVEVIVETGKVQVSGINVAETEKKKEVLLSPGEKGTFYITNNLLEKSVNSDLNFLAWKTHNLVFNEVPLHEVIRCLEKVYHIDIHIKEPELSELVLTAQFDQKPVDFILDVVRLTFNLELTGEDKQFTLSSRKNEQVKL